MAIKIAYTVHWLTLMLIGLGASLALSACSITDASVSGAWRSITVTPTSSLTPALTETPLSTPSPGSAEMSPEYPYISGITPRAHEILTVGQSMGNRANVFSKVGDSITVSNAFLKPFSEGNYNLRDYAYLQPVIDYYLVETARDNNSFANASLAAKGGWSVWHEFDADSADSSACLPGETPLVCEYRVVRPAVALILLGTNDVLTMSTGRYEEFMRRVIETSIDMGVIPVVSTLPDYYSEEAKVRAMNEIIVRLSREYQVPLWDYWASLQPYPKRGLSIDGVHPSWAVPADFTPDYLHYGLTNRNLTALQALDTLWRLVIEPGE